MIVPFLGYPAQVFLLNLIMTNDTKKIAKQGLLYTICTFGGNILNLVFNFYLGRVLSVETFSLIALYLGIQYSIGIFFNAINFTVINTVSSAATELKDLYAFQILKYWSKYALAIGSTVALIWFLITPISANIWNVHQYDLYLFSVIFVIGSLIFINRGVLLSKFKFIDAAIVFISESFTKLLLAAGLVTFGYSHFSYAAIPIAILIAYFVSRVFIAKADIDTSLENSESKVAFPKSFYIFSLMLGLSTLTFLSFDVILAKAFFSPADAGAYALLALAGKIIFLFSSIVGSMFIPYFSSKEKQSEHSIDISRLFYLVTGLIVFFGSTFFILFGPQIFLMIFGEKVLPITQFFVQYTLSISAFSLSYALVLYHQSKRQYVFPIISSISSVLLIVGTMLFHQNLSQFISVFSIISAVNFVTIFICHVLFKNKQNVETNDIIAQIVESNSQVGRRTKSVTIGIPAYNEEANIGRILESVLNQVETGFKIDKVIVACDGCKDRTVEIVHSFDDPRILLVEGKENRGLNYRHNQIMRMTTSDILVLINADIAFDDNYVISHLVKPLVDKTADFTAQWAKPVKARTLVEQVLNAGFELKYYIYSRLKGGNNIYTCVGHMRALSKKVYTSTIFPLQSEGEDQFLYLSSISRGYKYKHAHKANAKFRLPSTWEDYKHYARRIFQTQRKHKDLIEEELMDSERSLPPKLLIEGIIYSILKNPIHSSAYVLVHIFMQKWALSQAENTKARYKVSETTKQLFFPED